MLPAALLLIACQAPPTTGPAASDPQPTPPEMTEAERRDLAVKEKLRSRIDVSFDRTPLSEAFKSIAEDLDVNMFVDWPRLHAGGVAADEPLTLNLKQITAKQAIQYMLRSIGNEFDPIGYKIDDDVITIGLARDLLHNTILKTYDIHDLLWHNARDLTVIYRDDLTTAAAKDLAKFKHQIEFAPRPQHSLSRYFGYTTDNLNQGRMYDDESSDSETVNRYVAYLDSLIGTIQESIGEQELWAAYGGDIASINEMGNQLIIRAPPEWHEQITALLDDLRIRQVDAAAFVMRQVAITDLLARAERERRQGRYEDALRLVREARRFGPDDPAVLGAERVLRGVVNTPE